jgi:hypothetical protein
MVLVRCEVPPLALQLPLLTLSLLPLLLAMYVLHSVYGYTQQRVWGLKTRPNSFSFHSSTSSEPQQQCVTLKPKSIRTLVDERKEVARGKINHSIPYASNMLHTLRGLCPGPWPTLTPLSSCTMTGSGWGLVPGAAVGAAPCLLPVLAQGPVAVTPRAYALGGVGAVMDTRTAAPTYRVRITTAKAHD